MLYSERQGKARGFDSSDLVEQIWDSLCDIAAQQHGLFDQAFGYYVDEWTQDPEDTTYVKGQINDIGQYFNRALKSRLSLDYSMASSAGKARRYGPALGVRDRYGDFNQNPPSEFKQDVFLLFDFLEVLFIVVSVPNFKMDKKRHISFAKREGQKIFRDLVNQDLSLYIKQHEMLANGQIVSLGNKASKEVVEDIVLLNDSGKIKPEDYRSLNEAIRQFYKENALETEKKGSILEVHGILEKYRKLVKQELLSDDERDLFVIANNFALRHNKSKQKGNYSKTIWYDWMFNVQLAAAVVTIKIIGSQDGSK